MNDNISRRGAEAQRKSAEGELAARACAIGVVPARRGSQGIPDKNVQLLCGRPLIAHTLLAARAATRLDHVLCSTDCPKVREASEALGILVISRPAELANNAASMRDVAADLHRRLARAARDEEENRLPALPLDRPIWYVLLYPTCPFRTAMHIDACLQFARRCQPFDSVVSVCEVNAAPPSGFVLDESNVVAFVDSREGEYYQRQQKTPKYRLNGAIWILNAARFDVLNRNMIGASTRAFVMDERSSLDIDSPIDLKLAELLMEESAERTRPWRAQPHFA